KELEVLLQRGFFRLVAMRAGKKDGQDEIIDLNETPPTKVRVEREKLFVLVDRLVVRKGDDDNLSRIANAVEQAFREGGARCIVKIDGGPALQFSEYFERDGIRFEEPRPHLFSFNSPIGACPTCQGFGRVAGLDEDLVIPNPDLSIRQGAIAPFRTDQWSSYFRDLIRVAADERLNIDIPFSQLSEEERRLVWEGKGDYVGIYGFFRFLEQRSYKMHYRIYHARFRGYTTCPD